MPGSLTGYARAAQLPEHMQVCVHSPATQRVMRSRVMLIDVHLLPPAPLSDLERPACSVTGWADVGGMKEAKEAKLVDELQHRTDFNNTLKETYDGATFERGYGLPDLAGPEIKSIFDIFKLMMGSGDGDNEG